MAAESHRTLPGAITLFAREQGFGPPLVLLHGLSAHSASWSPVVDRFGDAWRCVALDFRGHGRSGQDRGGYRLDDYCDDVDRLLHAIGGPAMVVGHSLGAVVAATLAQRCHPLVTAVFLDDPPLYLLEPDVFAGTGFARSFPVLREHVEHLQAAGAPVEAFRDLIGGAPHPAGDTQADHLLPDALLARAEALALMDVDTLTAVLDGRTFAAFDPDRPIGCPALIVRADPACDPGFLPEHEARLRRTSPHAEVIEVPGAAHNIRGDRAGRERYLDVLGAFLARHGAGAPPAVRVS